MLLSLSIQDVVIIKQLELDFSAGLSTLTGETGAGKSILLDSLNLALGGRADASLIRSGQSQASVTAVFQPKGLANQLEALGLPGDDEDELRLRRVVKADGKSRAYINEVPVAAKVLREIGSEMAEIQGQFEQHSLLAPGKHRRILDAFGGLEQKGMATAKAYQLWQDAKSDLDQRLAAIEKDRQDEDYLRHVSQELSKVAPEEGEHDALAEKRLALQSAEKLGEFLTEAMEVLQADQGVDAVVSSAIRALARVPTAIQNRVDPIISELERAVEAIATAMSSLEALQADQDADPAELDTVAERLFLLKDLARKHGCEPDELPHVLEKLEEQLQQLAQADRHIEDAKAKVAKTKSDYEAWADMLTEGRTKAAKKLDKAIMKELAPLKLDRAQVQTEITALSETQWSPRGKESVQFQVAMNSGDAFGPIGKVASGGELSRFLLALKVVLAGVSPVPTLIFDEVDAGLGGATADAVGERLDRLAQDLQLLTITHSPQVASRAQTHYRVDKRVRKGETETRVVALKDAERVEEIARMLSGATITDEARAAAKALLDRS